MGRVASTLQRFTSNDINWVNISFLSRDIITSSYHVDLESVTEEQFTPVLKTQEDRSNVAIDVNALSQSKNNQRFSWGLGPYITHRLFNPELPLSLETGAEFKAGYQITSGLKISGAVRKSILTNLTDNIRRSNSVLPRVHSDWPLYDIEGQPGHIHDLKLSYAKNLAPGLYGRAHGGLLEPFFAGSG